MQQFLFTVAVAVAVFAMVMAPLSAQAISFGVTPSQIEAVVEQDTITTYSMTFSRNAALEYDEVFDVTANGDIVGLLQTTGNATMVFPTDEQVVEYTFKIDATGIIPGTYKGGIEFLKQLNSSDETVGIDTRFGLTPQVIIEVVEDLPDVLDGVEDPTVLTDIDISDLLPSKTAYEQGEEAIVTWQVNNLSATAVQNIPYSMELISSNGADASFDRVEQSVVPAGGDIMMNFPFEPPVSGTYILRLTIGETTHETSFTVTSNVPEPPSQIVAIMAIIMGIIAISGILILTVKFKAFSS